MQTTGINAIKTACFLLGSIDVNRYYRGFLTETTKVSIFIEKVSHS
jgi:hypothetical protein